MDTKIILIFIILTIIKYLYLLDILLNLIKKFYLYDYCK